MWVVGTFVAYVRDLLVGNGTIVLEDVVVDGTRGIDNLLQDGLDGISHQHSPGK